MRPGDWEQIDRDEAKHTADDRQRAIERDVATVYDFDAFVENPANRYACRADYIRAWAEARHP